MAMLSVSLFNFEFINGEKYRRVNEKQIKPSEINVHGKERKKKKINSLKTIQHLIRN